MSCTDPILSFEALIQRAVKYSAGCGALKYVEERGGDPLACAEADTPDLVLLAMAFDTDANVFRVAITNVSIDDLCENYSLRMECAGITASQALRETVNVGDGVGTIRVLFVSDANGECSAECVTGGLEELIGSTVVTDGTDTYVLAIAPGDGPSDLDCTSADVGAETFARSAIATVGSCGMRAWMVEEEELGGGDFNNDFSNDFNI